MRDVVKNPPWLDGAIEIVVNLALPVLIFTLGRARLGDLHALVAASLAPLLWSVVEFARKRRIDALSIIVLVGISFSLVAMLASGSVRLVQLREQFVIGLIGLVFLTSVLVKRPLIYYLARARIRRRSSSEAEAFEDRRDEGAMRRTMSVLTLTWGLALLADAALGVALVFLLPTELFLVVSPIVGYGAVGVLTIWTYAYARRRLGRPAAD